MVRVGISALTLVPGVVGGSETAFRSLLRELHRSEDIAVQVYLPSIAPDAGEGQPARVVTAYPASRSTPGRIVAMGSALLGGGRVRRAMRLDEVDLVHFPFSTMIPTVREVPTVSSILDVQHEYIPEFFSRSEIAYRRLVYGRTARLSDRVIAISHHAATAIHERLMVPMERIRVIHLGCDPMVFSPAELPREPFLLYPANAWPHKNHARLFEAVALLRRARPELRLILTGSDHERLQLPEFAESRGRVPTDDLVHLYRTASALIYPSLYEGFGIPIVEAMSTGCPVASSDAASLPEVCGDAATLFDARDPEAIADAIDRVLSDPAPYVARGLERAPLFTWRRCAEAHVAVYRELAS
jgi:glycosyltransferase involved in cell wall biosynthesis